MSDNRLSRLVDAAKRTLLDRGARPVADSGRRRFFRRAGAVAIGTGLLMPEVARAATRDIAPGTVVDAAGRPIRNPQGNQPYVGEIMLFGGNFAVRQWANCDGQLLAVASNDALFSILGTTYGGDGRTTFGVPDLRGRTPVNAGAGPGLQPVAMGQKYGAETLTLTSATMPSHAHTLPVLNAPGDQRTPSGNILAGDATNDTIYAPTSAANGSLAPTSGTGGNMSFNIRSPFLSLSYQIALYGIYPSRS
ncbi:phage tail protein [Rubrivirga sp. SAORIC476]|uniref:phage tail protein n=1 Tax=Rubrivirga sp. SAORIC476 TaxID=1961794 RepID=UPI0018E9D474|nr:tail fiber protein [Rubrivirga sp. SAORIC476]